MAPCASSRSLGAGCQPEGESVIMDDKKGTGRDPMGLGGEASLLDPSVEAQGVKDILGALGDEEKRQMPDPCMPIRHFRAEKGDAKKAIEKLKAALQWRLEFGVDRIRSCMNKGEGDEEMRGIIAEENSTGKIYVRGYDKDGRAFMYMRPARENTNNEVNNMRHLVWNLEKAIACTARMSVKLREENNVPPDKNTTTTATPPVAPVPQPLEKVNLVIDYEGFRLRDAPPLSTSKYTLDILQKHYPERMHRAYLLNPPAVFRTFWAIVRPFIDPVTKQKIVFCSGRKGLETLKNAALASDKLEPAAGGTCPVRDFDSDEYLHLPFNIGYDEF